MSEENVPSQDTIADHVQRLKDNPPVEPNRDELEEHQYQSAKENYDRAIVAWQEELTSAEAQLLTE